MRYRPMIPRVVMAAMMLAMLTGCDGCAGKANIYAEQRTFDSVKPRLEKFAVEHPERKEAVDAAIASYVPSGDIAAERKFADQAIPMLRQSSAEARAAGKLDIAADIDDTIQSWEMRLKKFETPPPK